MEHLIRLATKEEAKIDCCGDRYECNVDYVCSCGEKSCCSCMMRHIFSFHWDVEAEKAIFKSPVTAGDFSKKSARGIPVVCWGDQPFDSNLYVHETTDPSLLDNSAFNKVFDGNLLVNDTFESIRKRVRSRDKEPI